jgi:hypothetical protein
LITGLNACSDVSKQIQLYLQIFARKQQTDKRERHPDNDQENPECPLVVRVKLWLAV